MTGRAAVSTGGSVSETVNGGMRQTPEGVIVPLQVIGVDPARRADAVPAPPPAHMTVVARAAVAAALVIRLNG